MQPKGLFYEYIGIGGDRMEDSKIVDLFWQRSMDAIDQTQLKYGSYCMSISVNIVSSEEDARECVNDTYLAAWNSIPPNRPAVLSSYLGKLVRRISIDRWRAMNSQKRGGARVQVALEELSYCLPGDDDPVKKVEAKELAQTINRFLETLKETERAVFLMRYFHMADLNQIEQSLHMSKSKVKSMLHRTREKLKIFLRKEGY